MSFLLRLCTALSIGVLLGFAGGAIKWGVRKTSTERQRQANQKIWKTASIILTFFTFLLLILGLIWCIYFLVLGVVDPAQSEYANNLAELIVSVLTVISIIFAFFEFIRKK